MKGYMKQDQNCNFTSSIINKVKDLLKLHWYDNSMIQTLIGVCVVVFLTTLTIIVLVSGLYMVDSHVWI